MNQRIKKLAEQAELEVNEVFVWWPEGPEREDVVKEKFAELIVKECGDLVQKYMSRFPEDHELTKQIKQHFGVKE